MAQRLTEIFQIGDVVEVLFTTEDEVGWRTARVRALQHPGVWVQTVEGGLWFVTNGKRIRPVPPSEPPKN